MIDNISNSDDFLFKLCNILHLTFLFELLLIKIQKHVVVTKGQDRRDYRHHSGS